MSRSEAFQAAVELSDRGKQEDTARNYIKALSLYEQALDYYLAALKAEAHPDMKKSISDRMRVYLDRAEQLKPVVQQLRHQPGAITSSNSTKSLFPPVQPPSASSATPMMPFNQLTQSFLPPSNTSSLSYQAPKPTNICAGCGGLLLASSLPALDRYWHPECFVGTVMCAGCFKPFSLGNIRYKVKDGNAYHPFCFEGTTGLTKVETRSFLGSSNVARFNANLPRRFFTPGERFQFHFNVENQTTIKITKIVAYLFKTETFMEIVGSGFERKARTTETKIGRTEYCDSTFPLVKTVVEGDFVFLVPSAIFPSEVTGVDASFVREYEFVVKCVLTRPLKDIKVIFGVTIQSSNS